MDISAAILCGPVPHIRNWRELHDDQLTTGEAVCRFAEEYLTVPDGLKVGQPIVLDDFQVAFILAVVDNPHHTRNAILSMARRNGKTALLAIIMLAYLVGPLSRPNQTIASAANSRDQAALLFRLMRLMVQHSPDIREMIHEVPSSKTMKNLYNGAEYHALSADAKVGFGQSLRVVVLDEAGQITGPTNAFVDMLTSSQGSYEDPVFITISTQAPSDADFLSIMIDDSQRTKDPNTVCHVYAADKDANLMDVDQWVKANPGLDNFRSRSDLQAQLTKASRLPSLENSARNLLLNQRVSRIRLWLAASAWGNCGSPPDMDLFRDGRPVSIGLDLSTRTDLTAAVLAAVDDNDNVHLVPYCFAPEVGLVQRAERDRAPYDAWARDGHLIAVPSSSIDYSWVCQYMAKELAEQNIEASFVAFDRWRIETFRVEADRHGFASFAEWKPVGQGYRDMSPRMESFSQKLLEGQICHGNHPLLTMAAANTIAVQDPAGNIKMDKKQSTQRIDPLVAAVMALHEVATSETRASDPMDWIIT